MVRMVALVSTDKTINSMVITPRIGICPTRKGEGFTSSGRHYILGKLVRLGFGMTIAPHQVLASVPGRRVGLNDFWCAIRSGHARVEQTERLDVERAGCFECKTVCLPGSWSPNRSQREKVLWRVSPSQRLQLL